MYKLGREEGETVGGGGGSDGLDRDNKAAAVQRLSSL